MKHLRSLVAGIIDVLPIIIMIVVSRAIDDVLKRYVSEAASWAFAGGIVFGAIAAWAWRWGPRRCEHDDD